jgi:hypothetical protein
MGFLESRWTYRATGEVLAKRERKLAKRNRKIAARASLAAATRRLASDSDATDSSSIKGPRSGSRRLFHSHSIHLGQDLLCKISPDGRGRQRFAAALDDLDPLVHDPAQFREHSRFLITVTAGTDDAGALANEASVLVGPLNHFHIPRTFLHLHVSAFAMGRFGSFAAFPRAPVPKFIIRLQAARFKWNLAGRRAG